MFIEVATGTVKTAIDIYDRRKSIAASLKRLRSWVANGTLQIGVFGAGGTWKSTLGAYLKGDLDTDQEVKEYKETIDIQRFKIPGEVSALLSIAPGQEARRTSTWNDLYREISAGKSLRLINVVSWGFHSSELEQEELGVYQPKMSDDDFRRAYLEDSRRIELEVLSEISPHVSVAPGKIKMVTLVTKQDLWWPERRAVKDFYEQGAYSNTINEIKSRVGAANFTHEFVSCVLVEQNLTFKNGFVLAPTVQGYDDPLRIINLHAALSAITQVMNI